MSIYSDFKCGAISDEELRNMGVIMNRQDRYWKAKELEQMYYNDDEEEDEDVYCERTV